MFSRGFLYGISEVAKNQNYASNKMLESINLWLSMYSDMAPWLKDESQSLGIPAIVASEVARSVTLEAEINVIGGEMAEFLDAQLKAFKTNLQTNVEYACAGGGLVFKPVASGDKITIEVVQADAFYPTSFDSNQKITGGFFIYRKWHDKKIYTRLERHELDGTNYTITNTAYRSTYEESLGEQCLLGEVKDWENIAPEVTLGNIESPLFAYFKIPNGNVKDPNSPMGVSVFSRAIGLIKQADLQYGRVLWEYEGGELAIDASIDAFKPSENGPVLPEGKERLYRINDLDAAASSGLELLKAWAPNLRDDNYWRGLNKLLCRIEDSCSLSRGTLSEAQVVEKTATEIKMMKQRTYAQVKHIQMSLESAIEDLVYAMYCIAVLYEICPDSEYNVTFIWDDSIIIDAEAERMRDMQEVSQGLMLDWEYRVKWYGEDEQTAKKRLSEKNSLTDDAILNFENELEDDEGSRDPNKGDPNSVDVKAGIDV